MYLNEKSWNFKEENYYILDRVLRTFLDIYASVKKEYPRCEIYVSDDVIILPSGKWFANSDFEYKRLFLSFWDKKKTYHSDDECECIFEGRKLNGGLEAYLNKSFMISFCFDNVWEHDNIQCEYYSLASDISKIISVKNVFSKNQLKENCIIDILRNDNLVNVVSFVELWQKREILFPHLSFAPNIFNNLNSVEIANLKQIVIKLSELEDYSYKHKGEVFNPDYLTKTTRESNATLERYKDEHTFQDENGDSYLASWHMRFTGMPGRIFFVPKYKYDKILVAYIGSKLPTVKYHN